MDLCVEMAEDENIYYFEKPEEPQGAWQSFTEVVSYEDANATTDEHYETAIEDDSQYYSVIEDQTLDKPELDPNEQVLQQLEYDLGYTNADLSAIAYPSQDFTKSEKKTNETDSEDQVILYRVEDSNELFAVQIARDADGNVQKYQYKVRHNEEGQLEAVPGTIRIQGEGEDFIPEITEKESFDPERRSEIKEIEDQIDVSEAQQSELQHLQESELQHLQDQSLNLETHQSELHLQQSELHLETQQSELQNLPNHELLQDQSELLQNQPQENTFLENPVENYAQFQSEFIPEPNDIVNQALQNAEFNEEFPVEGYYDENATYINGNATAGQQFKYYEQDEFTNVEYLLEDDEKNRKEVKKLKPKQILNKLNASIHNESIELKRIPEKHSSNKLTFLIVTHPVPDNQNPSPRPQLTQLQNKKFVYQIPGILNSINAGQTQVKRFNRSILRPTSQQSKSTLQKSVLQKSLLQQSKTVLQPSKPKYMLSKPLLKFKSQLRKVEVQKKTEVVVEPKGPRQPRKQVITPVDRVGSEIIIQAPEDKIDFVETYDLDELSDDDYVPKHKKSKTPKKRKVGRKPKRYIPTIEISNSDSNSRPGTPVLNDETYPEPKNETTITKYNGNVIQKKRGPGRPRLNHNKNFTYIQKEVIMQQDNKSPGRGRPKFIRTQQNNPNFIPPKSEFKENTGVPRKRGRPPKAKVQPKVAKKKEIDHLMDRMDDIHGREDDEEEEMIEERLEDDEEDQNLLSILETPLASIMEELEEGEVTKEDILTMSLKDAKIIQTVDHIKEHLAAENDDNNLNEESKIKPDQIVAEPAPFDQIRTTRSTKPLLKRNIYKCTICSKTFSKHLLLKTHKMESHNTTKNNFQCSSCSRIFFSENTLKFHETTRHSKKAPEPSTEFKCPVCPKTFKFLTDFTRHQFTHKKLACANCGQIFTSQPLLTQHMRLHCLKVPKSPKSSPTKLISCDKCPKKFANKVFLNNHMQREHLSPTKRRVSTLLPEVPRVSTLSRRSVVPELPRVSTMSRRSVVPELPRVSTMSRRSVVPEVPKPTKFTARTRSKCEECNLEFATPVDLLEHNKKHKVSNFKCQLCGFGCDSRVLLDKHTETHTEVKLGQPQPGVPNEVTAEEKSITNQMLSAIKNIDRKKAPHGGIPITLKMRRRPIGASLV